MKKAIMDNPNKMHFESPLKVFNEQTNLIGTGNMISATQYSGHIRAHNDVASSNGYKYEPGYLQGFDLQSFRDYQLPESIFDKIKYLLRERGGILYLFKHYNSKNQVVLDGLVLTDGHHNHIHTWYLRSDHRAWDVVDEARKYVINDEEQKIPVDQYSTCLCSR